MNDLSHLTLKEYFQTAEDGDYHIYNVPDSNVVRKEVKRGNGFVLIIIENDKELGRQTHASPIK